MDLVVAIISALLGLSVAFFLSISFYDLVPESGYRLSRAPRSAAFEAFGGGRRPLLARTIEHTPLD